MLLHTGAFTQQCVYTHVLSHRDAFYTEEPLHTEAFADKYSHTKIFLQQYIYTEAFLCTDNFAKRCFYTQILLQNVPKREREIHTSAFTERCSYTQCLSTGRGSDTGMVLNRDILMQRILLHTGPLTQRCFQHRDAFAHRRLHIEIRS